jgi:hypothetical protein
MAVLKAANVTKYDAGGTGDNIIGDGYIKTVEKIWYDTYTLAAATALASHDTIDLAWIPANKKIMDIVLYFPALSTGATATGTTISLGYKDKDGVTSATTFLSAGEACAGIYTLRANQGIGTVVGSGGYKIIAYIGRIATTTTAATITSIVRYT